MAENIIRFLPFSLTFVFGGVIGGIFFLISSKHRRLAKNNFHRAFYYGARPRFWFLNLTALRILWRTGGNIFCGMKMPFASQKAIAKRTEIHGAEIINKILASGSGIVVATLHSSNWELLTQAKIVTDAKYPLASLYQPLRNSRLNNHIRKLRQRRGFVLLDRRDGFFKPMEVARNGVLGILVDQNAGKSGILCPFFDRLASTSKLAGMISKRTNAHLLVASVSTTGLGKWRLSIHDPQLQARENSVGIITAKLNLALEKAIKKAPLDWFWVHNRWKAPTGTPLFSAKNHPVILPPNYAKEKLQKYRVLLRSPNWLGDACMAIPAVRTLQYSRPDLHLTILCRANLAQFWQKINPALVHFDDLIALPKQKSLWFWGKKLRQCEKFDLAILLPNSLRTAFEAKLAGVQLLAGFARPGRKFLLKICQAEQHHGKPAHHSHRYLRLLRTCGAKHQPDEIFNFTTANFSAQNSSTQLVVCAGAAFGDAKRWPADKFAKIIYDLLCQYPHSKVVLVGAPGEEHIGEKILSHIAQIKEQNSTFSKQLENIFSTRLDNQIGKSSLSELVQILQSSTALLSNDTGTMHLAAVLGLPLVAVFGSTEPQLTRPLGENSRVLREHIPCSPCFLRQCPQKFALRCMHTISTDQVYYAVLKKLNLI